MNHWLDFSRQTSFTPCRLRSHCHSPSNNLRRTRRVILTPPSSSLIIGSTHTIHCRPSGLSSVCRRDGTHASKGNGTLMGRALR